MQKTKPLDVYELDMIGSFIYRYSDYFQDHCERLNKYAIEDTHELIMKVSTLASQKAFIHMA
jgi:hypothetical protein